MDVEIGNNADDGTVRVKQCQKIQDHLLQLICVNSQFLITKGKIVGNDLKRKGNLANIVF